jgi:type II secretory pathway pseudopilin PulG
MIAARPKNCRGISLLEVLISMGILSVGLASVLALIPAGKSQSRKAAIDDARGNLGASAIADVINRGMLRPAIWSNSAAAAVVYDPLFAYVSGSATSFPAGLIPITLGNLTGAAVEEVCRSQDDLIYKIPDDDDSPALPVFASNGKRQSQGSFSWLATLVPAQTSATPEFFRLSIVEFHKRPFDVAAGAAWLTFQTGTAIPDGIAVSDSATVGIPANTNSPMTKEQFSDFFKAGTVVLLSDAAAHYRWVRVIMAAPHVSTGGDTVDSVDLTFDQDVTPSFESSSPTRIDVYAGAVGVAEQIVRLEGESPWVAP